MPTCVASENNSCELLGYFISKFWNMLEERNIKTISELKVTVKFFIRGMSLRDMCIFSDEHLEFVENRGDVSDPISTGNHEVLNFVFCISILSFLV